MDKDLGVRYVMEHKALPNALYENRAQLLLSLLRESQNAMMNFYGKAESDMSDYICPYYAEQFRVDYDRITQKKQSALIVRITMPVPEEALLCRAVYLCFSADNYEDFYFTSELTAEGKYFLCGWTPAGAHLNFGEAEKDELNEVERLFWDTVSKSAVPNIRQ